MRDVLGLEAKALEYVRTTEIAGLDAEEGVGLEAVETNAIDIDNLPKGLVIGKTLLDVSQVPSENVRAGLSLALLFASRVATNDPAAINDEAWFASYAAALGKLGFRVGKTNKLESTFEKTNVAVHKAIIPFITSALGAGAGPMIIAALQSLQETDKDSPWITLFDREARRFSVKEMHFGAAVTKDLDTEISYAVARLNVDLGMTKILFFKITNNSAEFKSETTPLVANNSLMAIIEDDLKQRLATQIKSFIFDANIG